MSEEIKVANGVTPKPKAVRFLHLRRPCVDLRSHSRFQIFASSKGGITAAYKRLDKYSYVVAFALCHKVDHYDKTVGRNIAKARLEEADNVWRIHTNTSIYDAIEMHLRQVKQLGKTLRPEILINRSVK